MLKNIFNLKQTQQILNVPNLYCKTININKSIYKLNKLNTYSNPKISNKFFFSQKIKEELKKELEKTEEELKETKNKEEIRKLFNSSYNFEELNKINQSKEEIKIMEITDKNLKNIKIAKFICLYFNLPVSFLITYFLEFHLGEAAIKDKYYYILLALDYILFFNGALVLASLRNVVLAFKYLPITKEVEVTKLNIFNKEKISKYKIELLKRTPRSLLSPLISLKHKKTNEQFSMNGIGKWLDIKLYNSLFPTPTVKQNLKVKEKNSPFDN